MRYYKANPVTWGGIKFDSEFEFCVFNCLRKYFDVRDIKVHKGLTVRPKTRWFPEQAWRVDFTVMQQNNVLLYVESKGIISEDFKQLMKNLSYFRPDVFERLVVVAPKVKTIARGFLAIDIDSVDVMLTVSDYDGLVSFCKKEI